MDEERFLGPGDAAVVLDLPWGRTGLAICYDLRFPELLRRYALDGARLIILPAEWPHPAASTGGRCCERGPSRTNVLWRRATAWGPQMPAAFLARPP